jgi:hypothetical protein
VLLLLSSGVVIVVVVVVAWCCVVVVIPPSARVAKKRTGHTCQLGGGCTISPAFSRIHRQGSTSDVVCL